MRARVNSDDIHEALAREAMRVRRLVLLSPPHPRKNGRCLYRVDLANGGTLKARRLEDAATAHRLFALRTGLDDAFAPAIAQHGPVLLEAWVAGTFLDADEAEARAGEAGALLARLHATPRDPMHTALDAGHWRTRATAELGVLGDAGALTSAEVARLRSELRTRDPGPASPVLAHRDFCAENMLIDGTGRLRVVDNEWLAIAPRGFDLGRTFIRWRMSPPAWTRFLAAYRAAAGCDPGPLEFWSLVAAVMSARFRLDEGGERLAAPLRLLRDA